MSDLKTADEYWRLAAQARADAWTARTLDARATFLQTEFNCELMAASMETLEGVRDALREDIRISDGPFGFRPFD